MPHEVGGCIYPTNAELFALQRDLMPRFMMDRVGFEILPFKESDRAEILFHEPDIFRGMQQWRGLDKPDPAVKDRYNPFGTVCKLPPGFWGEHDVVTEEVLTMGANPTSICHDVIDISEFIADLQARLVERRLNRVEFNIWQSLIFGRYQALNPSL